MKTKSANERAFRGAHLHLGRSKNPQDCFDNLRVALFVMLHQRDRKVEFIISEHSLFLLLFKRLQLGHRALFRLGERVASRLGLQRDNVVKLFLRH